MGGEEEKEEIKKEREGGKESPSWWRVSLISSGVSPAPGR